MLGEPFFDMAERVDIDIQSPFVDRRNGEKIFVEPVSGNDGRSGAESGRHGMSGPLVASVAKDSSNREGTHEKLIGSFEAPLIEERWRESAVAVRWRYHAK